jgi:hypothetical protein
LDSKLFEEKYMPNRILRFENVICSDPESKKNDYIIKVWFESKEDYRLLYNYSILHGENKGKFTLERTSFDMENLGGSKLKEIF